MSNLTNLVVGKIPDNDPMKSLFQTFHQNILEFENVLTQAMAHEQMPNHMILFGSYSCRTLLESTFTALIARVDPLRILFLHAHQNSDQYETSQRNKSAVQWTGDVLPKEKIPEKIWTMDTEKNTWRALLGEWQNKLILEPSFKTLADSIIPPSEWLANLLRISPEGIGASLRGNAETLYSELSKAVHAEYVIPRSSVIDVQIVRDHISRTFQLIAKIALLSHFSSVPHGSLPRVEAIQLFIQTEESINVPNN